MSYPENPILTMLRRNGSVESVHRGAWVAVRANGEIIGNVGDPQQLVFPRSASKSIQALPLIESGAADHFGFGNKEIALAIASHSGESQHLDVVASMLGAAGLSDAALLCGPQAPRVGDLEQPATRILNNCSGKHAGFLATAVHMELEPKSYLDPAAAVQQAVHAAVADLAQTDQLSTAIDGCGAPTFRLPLVSLAGAIASVTNPTELSPSRRAACERIVEAAAAFPELVGGVKGRLDSDLMRVTKGRVFAKVGAEAVFVIGVVGDDFGLAIKIDDGGDRGISYYLPTLLNDLGVLSDDELTELKPWNDPTIRNWDGLVVGKQETVPWKESTSK